MYGVRNTPYVLLLVSKWEVVRSTPYSQHFIYRPRSIKKMKATGYCGTVVQRSKYLNSSFDIQPTQFTRYSTAPPVPWVSASCKIEKHNLVLIYGSDEVDSQYEEEEIRAKRRLNNPLTIPPQIVMSHRRPSSKSHQFYHQTHSAHYLHFQEQTTTN